MQSVAVVVQEGVEPFGLGSLCEVWGEEYHPDDDNPIFDFSVCTPRPGRVAGSTGFDIHVDRGLEATETADLVCVATHRDWEAEPHPEVVETLRAAAARGAYVSAHCTGVWMLGWAGLLDGRRCTTHWRHGEQLQQAFPTAQVETDVLYVLDDNILTGAGSAAGIDAALHLMRLECGAKAAATAARRIVVPPHRSGGQAQFIRTPIGPTEAETLSPLLDRVEESLGESWPVSRLAQVAHMSPRTFARRFRDETGTTPLQWLTMRRVALAEELLEHSDLSVEQIADRVGFSNAAAFRHHFGAALGTTPQAYRRTFAGPEAAHV